jgi:hypothetical protein
MASTDKHPTVHPEPWDSARHMAPDPSLPVEAQLQWYKIASHVLLLNCSELCRHKAAAEAGKALAMSANAGQPAKPAATCPACRSVVEAPGGVLASHAAGSPPSPCVGSGWTVKGEHQ